MKFDELLRRLTLIEGDIKPKEVFWQHATKQPAAPVTSVVGTDPTGPIIMGGLIHASKLKQVIQASSFTNDFAKGPIESQELLRELLNSWLSGRTSLKSEHKYSLIGGGFIWDANSIRPSIKVRFDLDGKSRTLSFRNVWWSYNEYERQFTA